MYVRVCARAGVGGQGRGEGGLSPKAGPNLAQCRVWAQWSPSAEAGERGVGAGEMAGRVRPAPLGRRPPGLSKH